MSVTNIAPPVASAMPSTLPASESDTQAKSNPALKPREEKDQQQSESGDGQKQDKSEEQASRRQQAPSENPLIAQRRALFQDQREYQVEILAQSMETDRLKLTFDTSRKRANGELDSITKAISAGAQAVKGIRY
ncbi:hypothetical protein CSB62_12765 [Vibrio splendidus]|uniref:Uncharacterized protein n=1 Tax=Vibrio lentus TaxID=136468 RepID=A0A2J6UC88_9VIBR|nr:hypothetical protein [Vibrio lentus]PHN85735.1 hypothetical protein CSB62_12765 [Vibrio splendidus]MCB5362028.1 hypothetical protein [Vibrio lentus]MCB5452363.1 hypothetical protein [Vibrio lentus]MCB5464397.1 hypothetical protein [Vibrio lentus]MCC4796291.1 hypothetical protein [Vibrio lentus]